MENQQCQQKPKLQHGNHKFELLRCGLSWVLVPVSKNNKAFD